jgi:cyclopropane fatty-acyl-phospholipid synthase-like methyltransferase
MPSDASLAELKRNNFLGSEKDYTYYISVLHQLGFTKGNRIFDFGCSWGYGSYQLLSAGFDVIAFEIAPRRRDYAKTRLNIEVLSDMESAVADPSHRGRYHCFFSSHVLEHVPSPARVFECAFELLQNGGLWVSFTPNGSSQCRAVDPNWSKWWGEAHPNFIDDQFLHRSFANSSRLIGSTPVYSAFPLQATETPLHALDDLSRGELFFAARRHPSGW